MPSFSACRWLGLWRSGTTHREAFCAYAAALRHSTHVGVGIFPEESLLLGAVHQVFWRTSAPVLPHLLLGSQLRVLLRLAEARIVASRALLGCLQLDAMSQHIEGREGHFLASCNICLCTPLRVSLPGEPKSFCLPPALHIQPQFVGLGVIHMPHGAKL